MDGHLAFLIGVEGRAGQPDDDNDHADVDDVAAIAAGVAPGQQVHGGKEVLAGLTGNHARAAEEFREDGGEDAGGHGEGDQRVEVAAVELAVFHRIHAQREADNHGRPEHDDGDDEVALDAAQRCGAPGQQRPDAGEEEQEQPDGDGHAVIPGRAHGDLVAHHVFADDREQRSPQNHEAGREQHQVVEQEARFAADQRLEMVFGLEMVAL